MFRRRVSSKGNYRRTDSSSYNKKTSRTRQTISQSTKNGSVRLTRSVTSDGSSSTYMTRKNGIYYERIKVSGPSKLKFKKPKIKFNRVSNKQPNSIVILLVILIIAVCLI